MAKQKFLVAIMYSLCILYAGNVREVKQPANGQNQELCDAFVEKVEYVYNYDLWFEGDPLGFTEDGYRKKALQVDLYRKNGVYYFIPLEDCNAELKIEGKTRQVRYNELNEGHYIFCTLRQRNGIERDHGIWYLQNDTAVRIEDIEGFTYLGMVEIDTSGEKKPYTMKLTENGYVRAIIEHIRNIGDLGDLPAGDYKVYIGWYGFSTANCVYVSGVIRQDSTYRCFDGWATRNKDGSYDASVYSTNGASERFPTVEEIPSAYDDAMHIVEAGRLVLDLKITGQEKTVVVNQRKEDSAKEETEEREITLEEAKRKIKDLYNYYHWFYGNTPYDIESLLEEGRTYDIYTDKKGNIFWSKENAFPYKGSVYSEGGIYRTELQDDIAGLPLYSYTVEAVRRSELQKIGKMDWHQPELNKPELPRLTEDGYIREVKRYIEDELSEKGKSGSYQIYFGRYEQLASDVRNISVAVTGSEAFYLQCWVTKYPDGTYECFPVGGSHMGEEKTGLKKVERIVQLERLRMELEI